MLSSEDLQKLIATNNRRLQLLKQKQAAFGYNTPPEILTEIEDIEAELGRLRVEFGSLPTWPATLPWNDHYHQLPERDVTLENMVKHLIEKQTQWGVFVSGMGGIGKTATAVEIARRCVNAGAFKRVLGDSAKLEFLINGRVTQASDKATLDFERLLNELGNQLGAPEIRTMPVEEKRHSIHHLLNKTPYLVIVDNLETSQNASQIVRDLPQLLGQSKAIITSREKVTSSAALFDLVGLEYKDSLFFLRQEAEICRCDDIIHAPDVKLRNIYQAVEGQPLALKLIVSQTLNFGLDFTINSLHKIRKDVYRFIYWDSWQQLSFTAQKLLIYLGSSPASVSLEELRIGLEDTDDLEMAIKQLINLSLIRRVTIQKRVSYSIHEMTRKFVNSDLPDIWQSQGVDA